MHCTTVTATQLKNDPYNELAFAMHCTMVTVTQLNKTSLLLQQERLERLGNVACTGKQEIHTLIRKHFGKIHGVHCNVYNSTDL